MSSRVAPAGSLSPAGLSHKMVRHRVRWVPRFWAWAQPLCGEISKLTDQGLSVQELGDTPHPVHTAGHPELRFDHMSCGFLEFPYYQGFRWELLAWAPRKGLPVWALWVLGPSPEEVSAEGKGTQMEPLPAPSWGLPNCCGLQRGDHGTQHMLPGNFHPLVLFPNDRTSLAMPEPGAWHSIWVFHKSSRSPSPGPSAVFSGA